MNDVSINLGYDLGAKYCNVIGHHQLTVVRKQQVAKSEKRKQLFLLAR